MVIPIASSVVGDVVKYGVEHRTLKGFDVVSTARNAIYNLVLSNTAGKYYFEPLETILKADGGKFCITGLYKVSV